jgi:hypothetical protein
MRKIRCGPKIKSSETAGRHGIARLLLTAILALTLLSPCSAQGGKPSLEYQVKASMIFNFLQFVEWPAEVMEAFPSVFPICLSGYDRFGSALEVMEREVVRGRRLKFQNIDSGAPEEITNCLALFVGNDQTAREVEILGLLQNRSILTIGESGQFLDHGGIINLSLEDGRVTFEVNRAAALRARLNLSSRLLRIASQVRE